MRAPPAVEYRRRLRDLLHERGVDTVLLWNRATNEMPSLAAPLHAHLSPSLFDDPERLAQSGYSDSAVASAMEAADITLARSADEVTRLWELSQDAAREETPDVGVDPDEERPLREYGTAEV